MSYDIAELVIFVKNLIIFGIITIHSSLTIIAL